MIESEREKYNQALQKAALAKGFDRIVMIAIFFVVVALAVIVYIQTSQYQNEMRANSVARDQQLDQLLKNQKAGEAQTESVKAYLRCVALIPQDLRTDENLNKCAAENKLPSIENNDGSTTTDSGTSQSSTVTPQQQSSPNPSAPAKTSEESTSPQPEQKSLLQTLTDPIKDLINNIL